MTELSGRCACGAVTWTYDGPAGRNVICHCEDCRRATSAPFSAFIGLKEEDLHWAGARQDWQSSPGTRRGFCPACGTRLYFLSERWPGEIHLCAATLDDAALYRPDRHVVWDQRAPWLEASANLPKTGGFGATPQSPSEETD